MCLVKYTDKCLIVLGEPEREIRNMRLWMRTQYLLKDKFIVALCLFMGFVDNETTVDIVSLEWRLMVVRTETFILYVECCVLPLPQVWWNMDGHKSKSLYELYNIHSDISFSHLKDVSLLLGSSRFGKICIRAMPYITYIQHSQWHQKDPQHLNQQGSVFSFILP